MSREVRLERLRPADVRAAMDAAPVAWIPMGAIEFHAEHLPLGTDGLAAAAVVERAASIAGGVVLPWTALTIGTLRLPWSLRYAPELVEAALRSTIEQVIAHGARVVVVHTGHAPLDLIHLIKRVCAEVAATTASVEAGVRVYGLCYLELNSALGHGLGTDWPVAVDHAAAVETSWIAAIAPDLVDLARLPEDPAASILGVYGPNPRGLASAAQGETQLGACATLLVERVRGLLRNEEIDTYADLRAFVTRYWPEPLEVGGRPGPAGTSAVTLRNPGAVSRYLTSLSLTIDGNALSSAGMSLLNPTVGETGVPVPVDSLASEAGFYVRRNQLAELRLPVALDPGRHRLELELGLAGVTSTRLSATLDLSM